MIRLGNTTFDDSVKRMSFAAFRKAYESNPGFMFELGQLGLDLEAAYLKITGNVSKAKEPDSKIKPGATDKNHSGKK
jgi:hypothetical protein